jgi:hypothetical protein
VEIRAMTAAPHHTISSMKKAHSDIKKARTARRPEPNAMRSKYAKLLLDKVSLVSSKNANNMLAIPTYAKISENTSDILSR